MENEPTQESKGNVIEFPTGEAREQAIARKKESRSDSMTAFEAWWHDKFAKWGGQYDRGEDLNAMEILEAINDKLDEFPEVQAALDARDKELGIIKK